MKKKVTVPFLRLRAVTFLCFYFLIPLFKKRPDLYLFQLCVISQILYWVILILLTNYTPDSIILSYYILVIMLS